MRNMIVIVMRIFWESFAFFDFAACINEMTLFGGQKARGKDFSRILMKFREFDVNQEKGEVQHDCDTHAHLLGAFSFFAFPRKKWPGFGSKS